MNRRAVGRDGSKPPPSTDRGDRAASIAYRVDVAGGVMGVER
jgi:hypothetical protein